MWFGMSSFMLSAYALHAKVQAEEHVTVERSNEKYLNCFRIWSSSLAEAESDFERLATQPVFARRPLFPSPLHLVLLSATLLSSNMTEWQKSAYTFQK